MGDCLISELGALLIFSPDSQVDSHGEPWRKTYGASCREDTKRRKLSIAVVGSSGWRECGAIVACVAHPERSKPPTHRSEVTSPSKLRRPQPIFPRRNQGTGHEGGRLSSAWFGTDLA